MAFLQRIVEFKISDTAFTTGAEGTVNLHFQKFVNTVTPLNDGTGMRTSAVMMAKMENITLMKVDADSIDIFNELNDSGKNFTVNIAIAQETGDPINYAGNVVITGEYSIDILAGTLSGFALECVDSTGFVKI
jgi:hypothetical protein